MKARNDAHTLVVKDSVRWIWFGNQPIQGFYGLDKGSEGVVSTELANLGFVRCSRNKFFIGSMETHVYG